MGSASARSMEFPSSIPICFCYSMQTPERCRFRCPPVAGTCLWIRRCRRPSSRKPIPCRVDRWCCCLDPAAKTHLERMGEEIVARIEADAVLEAAGQAGLELHRIALLDARIAGGD